MNHALTQSDVDRFRETGCVTLPGAVTDEQLGALRTDLASWVEESQKHMAPFGAMLDGRPRFDLEPGHSAETPGLRRVASPTELSDAYLDILRDSAMVDWLTQLIGPDLRFHHSKINSKLPGTATIVDWHQDFTFDPHSNSDLVTCLLFLDDVTLENGPLMTVPGSHLGPLHTLWHEGRFTGAVDDDTAREFETRAIPHTGPAGSVCFMHSKVAHASRANRSAQPRSLFIAAIAAADSVPLFANAVPSRHEGMILRGRDPGRIRAEPFEMARPEVPKGASFFDQQRPAVDQVTREGGA